MKVSKQTTSTIVLYLGRDIVQQLDDEDLETLGEAVGQCIPYMLKTKQGYIEE